MGPKGTYVWTTAFASAGDWDISACEQQGSCPYFHTFGTSLSPVCFFGWASLHLEMIRLSKSIMGPSLVMLSLTSVKVTPCPGKGYRQGGRLLLAISTSSASVRLSLLGCWQKTGLCGCWWGIALMKESLPTGGPYGRRQPKPSSGSVPDHYHICVWARKWEPR